MDKNKLSFSDKIVAIKQKLTGSGASEDALHQVRSWEDRMSKLKVQQDWLQHPCTKELARIALEQVKGITSTLGNNENIPEMERGILFAEKKAHFTYLAVLTENPESEIDSLEKRVNEEL